jgi:excinuclease ABC subunit A
MTEINDYLKLLWPRIAHAFCPSCGREIRPESAIDCGASILSFERRGGSPNSIAGFQSLRSSVGQRQNRSHHVLGRSPSKTEPRKFFDFLQQQGYLRVWIDNKVVRVDDPNPKIKRLGARVQVVQDRIAITGKIARDWSKQSRPRCALAKARSMSFDFRKRRTPNAIERRTINAQLGERITDPSEFPFSTGWHCAWCDLDIRPPTVGLFSFNNPLGACPDCRGFGRTIAIDLNKAIPDRSLSIKQGVVRVFRGAEFGESQKDLLRACAAKTSISTCRSRNYPRPIRIS